MAESPADADALVASGQGVRLLLVTAPPGQAEDLARTLVEERLAACVNIVPGLRSVYHWQGATRDEPETLLIVKTARERVEALTRRLAGLHPYEVPEVLCLTPEQGLAAYLRWVRETSAPEPGAEGSA